MLKMKKSYKVIETVSETQMLDPMQKVEIE